MSQCVLRKISMLPFKLDAKYKASKRRIEDTCRVDWSSSERGPRIS